MVTDEMLAIFQYLLHDDARHQEWLRRLRNPVVYIDLDDIQELRENLVPQARINELLFMLMNHAIKEIAPDSTLKTYDENVQGANAIGIPPDGLRWDTLFKEMVEYADTVTFVLCCYDVPEPPTPERVRDIATRMCEASTMHVERVVDMVCTQKQSQWPEAWMNALDDLLWEHTA